MLTLSAGKRRVVEYVLSHVGPFKVRETARVLGVSPALVSRTFRMLEGLGVLRGGKLNLDSPLTRAMKILLNVERIVDNKIPSLILELKPRGAGIYGSWASGTNFGDSDLDMWILFDNHPGEAKIAELSRRIRRRIGGDVHILLLTPERTMNIKVKDPIFYYSLVFSSIVICGEGLG